MVEYYGVVNATSANTSYKNKNKKFLFWDRKKQHTITILLKKINNSSQQLNKAIRQNHDCMCYHHKESPKNPQGDY